MKRKDFIFLLASIVVLSIAWVIFNIIHQSITSTISETTASQINPIKPNFDLKTVDLIKKREQVAPMYTFESQSASNSSLSTPILITPTPLIPTPTPTFIIAIPTTKQASGGATR